MTTSIGHEGLVSKGTAQGMGERPSSGSVTSCVSTGGCPGLRLLKSRGGAVGLILASLVYLGGTLVTGHSAASQPPVETSAPGAAVGPWDAARLLLSKPAGVLVVDTRSSEQYREFRLPHSVNVPEASLGELTRLAGGRPVLLVAAADAAAAELVGKASAAKGSRGEWHYLEGGARAWYVTFVLPAPLFSETPPPFGYTAARDTVMRALEGEGPQPGALEALGKLQSFEYAPTLLAGKKPAPSGKKRKKISGGCGG